MKTKNAQTVGVHLDNEIVEMLARRATARGVTKSRYAAMLFEKWRDEKYPALDTVDSTARALVTQELNDEKSKAQNPQKGSPTRAIAKATDTAQRNLRTKLTTAYKKPAA